MKFQTYKGWFYIAITALLFFLLVKKHLKKLRSTERELKNHQVHLQELLYVDNETINLHIFKLNFEKMFYVLTPQMDLRFLSH